MRYRRRYNVKMNAWEVGFYKNDTFFVVRFEKT